MKQMCSELKKNYTILHNDFENFLGMTPPNPHQGLCSSAYWAQLLDLCSTPKLVQSEKAQQYHDN